MGSTIQKGKMKGSIGSTPLAIPMLLILLTIIPRTNVESFPPSVLARGSLLGLGVVVPLGVVVVVAHRPDTRTRKRLESRSRPQSPRPRRRCVSSHGIRGYLLCGCCGWYPFLLHVRQDLLPLLDPPSCLRGMLLWLL